VRYNVPTCSYNIDKTSVLNLLNKLPYLKKENVKNSSNALSFP